MIEEQHQPDKNSHPPAAGDIGNPGNQSDDASQGSNIAKAYEDDQSDNRTDHGESASDNSGQDDCEQSDREARQGDDDQGDREARQDAPSDQGDRNQGDREARQGDPSDQGDHNQGDREARQGAHSDQGDREARQGDHNQGDREGRPYNTPYIVRATLAVALSRLAAILSRFTAALPRLVPIFETALIVAGLYAMLEWLPLRVFSDGDVRLFAIYNLVHHHTLSHMAYSIIGPAFSIPLVIVDKFTPTMYWWQKHYNVFLLASAMLLAYVALRKKIDHSLLRRFFLVLLVASMFGNNVTFYGGEMFTTLCVGFGVLVMLLGSALATRLSGWVAIVLGVANTPATLVGLGLMVVRHVLVTRRARYLLAVVAAAAIILGEAWIRRGSPFNNGYGNQQFSTPFFIGLLSILFSFGKGLIFFTPGLLLPVKKSIFRLEHEQKAKLYEAYVLWICFLAGMILLYSSWWAWDGGWFWGPRFFVFACIPASFALAVRLRKPASSLWPNLLTLFVLALSLWVGINGAIFDQGNLAATCVVHSFAQNGLCQYDPRYSALWHPFFTSIHFSRPAKNYIALTLVIALYIALPLLRAIAKEIIAQAKAIVVPGTRLLGL